jgi:hypothetical protein
LTIMSPLALQQRPALAAHIGTIAVTWAQIEHELGILLADLLGTDANLGITIFLGLRTEGPQRTVIKAAAEARLSTGLAHRMMSFVANDLRDGAKPRNNILHGLWAAAPEYPKALIWIDRREALRLSASHGIEPFEVSGSEIDILLENGLPTLVYEQEDLIEVQGRMADLFCRLVDLRLEALRELPGAPPQSG